MSATPLTLLKLCVCFLHDMRMCMWFAYNCCINFCQFSPFIYRLCEHIPYNTIPILCPLLKLMLHLCPPPGAGATPLSAEFWFNLSHVYDRIWYLTYSHILICLFAYKIGYWQKSCTYLMRLLKPANAATCMHGPQMYFPDSNV